ncbi:MAG: c-type cytochrome biogenesis protein CcmI [Rhodospirillaceae bacterium]|nr:c-type cytochrome biogenesis protein CcmI [Rhodospirillaceae bacterium]
MIWALIAAVALAAIAALLWPLLRAGAPPQDRAAYNLAVFQDQLKEVDRDVARGVLTPAEADAARLEIQRRIIATGKIHGEAAVTDSPARRNLTAGAIAVVVPALALATYLSLGRPTLPAAEPGLASHDADDAQIAKMVDQLAAKVAANPNDPQGLILLARTYRQLGRFDEAIATYQKLTALQPDADTFAGLGEAETAAAGGNVTPEAHAAFMKALGFDRNEPRSRFYLGLEYALKGDAKTAIAIWRDLAASSPPDAPWVPAVREEMAQVAQAAGIPPMSVTPAHPLDILPAEATAAAAPAQPVDSAGFSTEQRQMIEGMVGGLAARLAQNPNDFDGWMMLGKSYTVLKKPEDAAKAFEKAMALKPGEIQPKLQFAALIVTGSTGPTPASAKALKDALAIDPKSAEALYLTGVSAQMTGDTALARKSFEQVPDGSPLKAEAAQQLKNLK